MTGINKTLFDWLTNSRLISESGWFTNFSKPKLEKALGDANEERFVFSIELSEFIWAKHPEFGLCPYLKQLGEAEYRKNFYAGYRDHSTHALKVYLLGLYFYDNNDTIKEMFTEKGFTEEKFADI